MQGHLFAVTVVGNDRPGIVAHTCRVLFELGCNLEDATSTILRGHFAMMLIVAAPAEVDGRTLEDRLRTVADELSLVITARPVEEARLDVRPATHTVSVYGADRPGIVYRVAELLASHGVNVTDLQSRIIDSDERRIYAVILEAAIPEGVDVEAGLRRLKEELGLDVALNPIDTGVM